MTAWPFPGFASPDGRLAYVTELFANAVSVIDVASRTVVGAPIPVGARPRGIAVTPDGQRVIVSDISTTHLTIIDVFGTIIQSTQPVIVEHSLYANANGVIGAAGTNATATRLP